jgi:hypothetical protein
MARLTALYDSQGMLLFSGMGRAPCLAYAELFGLRRQDFTLVTLMEPPKQPRPARAKRNRKRQQQWQ